MKPKLSQEIKKWYIYRTYLLLIKQKVKLLVKALAITNHLCHLFFSWLHNEAENLLKLVSP